MDRFPSRCLELDLKIAAQHGDKNVSIRIEGGTDALPGTDVIMPVLGDHNGHAPASATRLDSCGAGRKSTSRTKCRRCQRRSRSAMPTVSLRMASPRLPQHWAASTGPPPSKARRSRSNKSKCFPIAVSGGFLLAKKTASETALNKPNRFIS